MKWFYLFLSFIFVLRARVVRSWIPPPPPTTTTTTMTTTKTASKRTFVGNRGHVLLLFGSNGSFDKDDAEFISAATKKSGGALDVPTDSTFLYTELFARRALLEQGIGKRYVCRTQQGFLNIHYEPGDPFNTDNIVGQLNEGQIVTSTGPPRGLWIRHDGGGWSISKYGGFTWLEALDE